MIFNSLPKDKNIIITANLRNLRKILNLDYEPLTEKIIDEISNNLCPKNIYVPTFNYDFLKIGTYDHIESMSQIGRFSEEFRKKYRLNRSLDPVFSYTSLFYDNKIDLGWCENAFENKSFFETLNKINYLVINIDLPTFTSTFIHYLENKYKVPYRYNKKFQGKIKYNDNYLNLTYSYFVRDLSVNSSYNGQKIGNFLKQKSILNSSSIFNTNIQWYHSDDLILELSKVVRNDINFFIN